MNRKLLLSKRKEVGLTQKQMAISLGYKDKSSYCLIENAKTSINLETAKKLKDILQLSTKEFNEIFFTDDVEVSQTSQAI